MTLEAKKPRMKTCKICKTEFSPRNSLQKACSVPCAMEVVKADKAKEHRAIQKKERAETLDMRRKLKTKSEWLRDCQSIVNKYVRLRDAHLGCVSCDKGPDWQGQWHASHLRSVGSSSATRFHLWNIHKSCSVCNLWLSANLSEYLPRVRAKIGDAKVDWLYQQNEPAKFTIEYLKRLKQVMSKKVRRLEKRLGL